MGTPSARSRSTTLVRRALSFALGILFMACGSAAPGGFRGDRVDDGDEAGDPAFAESSASRADGRALLRGTVHAPQPKISISGALVYLTDESPDAIPPTVFCDRCVRLVDGTPFTLSDAKGDFSLPASKLGKQYLVVQKGGFRRVRPIEVKDGDQNVAAALTTLPAKADPAKGDEVPRMAIVKGSSDPIEESLVKLGVAREALTMTSAAILRDAAQLKRFHIVFLPCGDDATSSKDATVQKNLRDFAAAGGRVYATDWHYDFVHQVWPGYVQFKGQSAMPCSGCSDRVYDAAATVDDDGLDKWLGVNGAANVRLEANYVTITSVRPVQSTAANGASVTVTPKVWVTGQTPDGARPATVSFEHACGRVLFSTYHTEPSTAPGLKAQELALLYVLLEVSVCNESPTGTVPGPR